MRVLAAIGSLVVALAAEPAADACSCGPITTCEALQEIDVAFVGTPVSVLPAAGVRTIELEVHEVLRGTVGTTVTIASPTGGGDCDYGYYVVGERMLILASRETGKLRVSMCSGSGPVADTGPRIAELRKLAAVTTGSVAGTVKILGRGTTETRAGMAVRLRGTPHVATTDAKGNFRFDVPPGDYLLDSDPDPDLAPHLPASIEVRAGACFPDQAILRRYNGRIAGTLRDRAGTPLASVKVCADVPASSRKCVHSALSDAAGAYEVGGLAPGDYRVGVSVDFDPTVPLPTTLHPTPVAVGRGTRTSGIDLVVPPRLPTRTIAVRVTSRDKKLPAWSEASVELRHVDGGRLHARWVKLGATVDFIEVDGTVQLQACMRGPCTPPKNLRLDRDTAIDLVIPVK